MSMDGVRRRTLFACYPRRWAVVAVEVSVRREGARDIAWRVSGCFAEAGEDLSG